jgi:SAM-dependent methyltransferase
MAGFGTRFAQLTRALLPRPALAPDGLPLPPARLIHAVAGTKDPAWFWQGGQLGAKALTDILARRGLTLATHTSILDFGCGCGRVIRHLAPLAPAAQLRGTDYNPALIRWCRRALPVAEFSVNDLAPPLRHADGAFDLIYAFSVFTHLTEPLQHAWIAELRRILRPGGLLIISTHGERYREKLPEADRARFDSGETIVWSGDDAGKNRCATFHPPAYVRERLAPAAGLEVLEFAAEGALGNPHQDAWLLRRPAAG